MIISAIVRVLTDQLLLCHPLVLQLTAVREDLAAVLGADRTLVHGVDFMVLARGLIFLIDLLEMIVQGFLKATLSWLGKLGHRGELEVTVVCNVLILQSLIQGSRSLWRHGLWYQRLTTWPISLVHRTHHLIRILNPRLLLDHKRLLQPWLLPILLR